MVGGLFAGVGGNPKEGWVGHFLETWIAVDCYYVIVNNSNPYIMSYSNLTLCMLLLSYLKIGRCKDSRGQLIHFSVWIVLMLTDVAIQPRRASAEGKVTPMVQQM